MRTLKSSGGSGLRVKFHTLGCKVNQYETQEIREGFQKAGFKEIDGKGKADVYLINTCTVTHRADSDSLAFIRKAIKENKKAKVVVTGCLVEMDAARVREACGGIIIVRKKDKDMILGRLGYSGRSLQKGVTCFKNHTRAFLKVQDGCDNFCAYCKVPLVRGVSRSKPLKEAVREAGTLAANGFKEIVLTGICLGAYGKDLRPRADLVDVIAGIEKINGVCRIRLSSIEAGDVTPSLVSRMEQSGKLCRHLHIPIQSGDDAILKKMNRKYDRGFYLDLIKAVKKRVPGVAITTDCLVGFPGEKEANFRNTLDLIKKILPLKVHIFPYSKRGGTKAAAGVPVEVPAAVIKERIFRLNELARRCSLDYRSRFLGTHMDVLIEGHSPVMDDCWEGYTDNYLRVLVKSGLDLKNKLVAVRLNKIHGDFCQADFS